MEVAGLSHCGGVTVVRASGLSEMTPRISIIDTRKTACLLGKLLYMDAHGDT